LNHQLPTLSGKDFVGNKGRHLLRDGGEGEGEKVENASKHACSQFKVFIAFPRSFLFSIKLLGGVPTRPRGRVS